MKSKKQIKDNKIVLLVRNYNRPEYLKKTLESLLKSDIDLCEKRYIYDDFSTDAESIDLLKDERYINVKGKEFVVVINEKNDGCKKSYLNALEHIKLNNPDCDYVCTVDNDVEVSENFISTMFEEYCKAHEIFNHKNILFTGFRATNAHTTITNDYGSFVTKTSFGGVNYFFHNDFMDFIYENWKDGVDWGVFCKMNEFNYPLCCTAVSCLNHVGKVGLHSSGDRYDTDEKF